jgi:hypothetical protein
VVSGEWCDAALWRGATKKVAVTRDNAHLNAQLACADTDVVNLGEHLERVLALDPAPDAPGFGGDMGTWDNHMLGSPPRHLHTLGQPHVSRHVIDTPHVARHVIDTPHVARHVIDTHLEPSFVELHGILRRGERYLPGPLPATSSTHIWNSRFLT